MTYPFSEETQAGDEITLQQYNLLRTDQLYFGHEPADSFAIGNILNRYSRWIECTYLDNDLIRIPFNAVRPPSIVIDGYLLKASANVDAASVPTGVPGTRFIKAIRTPGSKTFTITIDNTSGAEAANERTIGEFLWTGFAAISVQSLVSYELFDYPQQKILRAWAQISISGNILGTVGISSVEITGTGVYVCTFLQPMFDTRYAATANAHHPSANFHANISSYNVGTVTVRVYNTANTLTNNAFTVVVHGAR